jgi:hypothetical protein
MMEMSRIVPMPLPSSLWTITSGLNFVPMNIPGYLYVDNYGVTP